MFRDMNEPYEPVSDEKTSYIKNGRAVILPKSDPTFIQQDNVLRIVFRNKEEKIIYIDDLS